jgi:hypothetical protein
MFAHLKETLHRNAPELQFWGYESGNVAAALAGAGGVAFLGTSDFGALLRNTPDLIATCGIAAIIIGTSVFGPLAQQFGARQWVDRMAIVLSVVLMVFALSLASNWITLAAIFFVTGSALLRMCYSTPVMLKLGGLSLAAGGVCLGAFGVDMMATSNGVMIGGLTALTGFYVTGASFLTYQGGIYACADAEGQGTFAPSGPVNMWLSRLIDPVVAGLNRWITLPSLIWVPADMKQTQPFLTSMWARLPWRILTAGAALSTGTEAGFLLAIANGLWAVGDIAIGAVDWAPEEQNEGALSPV